VLLGIVCTQPEIIGAQGGVAQSGLLEELVGVVDDVALVVRVALEVDVALVPDVVLVVELVCVKLVFVLVWLVALPMLELCDRVVDGATNRIADAKKITITTTATPTWAFDTPWLAVIMLYASSTRHLLS
jgi:hypothetical protein